MNLKETLELYAGGPGSGCHGPNCGRPKGGAGSSMKDYGTKLKDAGYELTGKFFDEDRNATGHRFYHPDSRDEFVVWTRDDKVLGIGSTKPARMSR